MPSSSTTIEIEKKRAAAGGLVLTIIIVCVIGGLVYEVIRCNNAGDTVEMTLQSLTVTEHKKDPVPPRVGWVGTYYKHKAKVTATFVKGSCMDPVQYTKRETIRKSVVGLNGSPRPEDTEFIDAALKKKIKGGIVLNGTYSVTLKKNGSFEKANKSVPGPSAVV
jgi:hypothetical protein